MTLAGEGESEIDWREYLDLRNVFLSRGIFVLPAMVDLPTPPFAEDTAITFRTSFTLLFSGRPRWRRGRVGGSRARGNPCNM